MLGLGRIQLITRYVLSIPILNTAVPYLSENNDCPLHLFSARARARQSPAWTCRLSVLRRPITGHAPYSRAVSHDLAWLTPIFTSFVLYGIRLHSVICWKPQ